MSGTLYPPSMYANILGLPQSTTTSVAYASPFAAMRRPVLVAKNVTTKYTERSPENTRAIRAHIQALIDASPGHVAVFAPSYAMLNDVVLEGHFSGARIMAESREWTKQDLDQVVDTSLRKSETAVKSSLQACLAPAFQRGLTITAGLLTPSPALAFQNSPPSVLSKSLKSYAEDRFGRSLAWRYTVSQTAVNSILQAMGRPIRSIETEPLILLLDRRHGPNLRRYFR